MAASLFAWLFNSVELTCLPAALKALILHSFFLFSYVNALKLGSFIILKTEIISIFYNIFYNIVSYIAYVIIYQNMV